MVEGWEVVMLEHPWRKEIWRWPRIEKLLSRALAVN
jgi:hypothetical protein